MFTAERRTNMFIVEWLVYSIIVGYVLPTIAIDTLSFIPAEGVELYLSILILISEAILFSGFLTHFCFFPLSIYVGAGNIIMMLCVAFKPTYIPLFVRLLSILTWIAATAIYYSTNDQKRWPYIYQFELLGMAKWTSYIFLFQFLFDTIDSAGYKPRYLLTIFPILILMGLTYFIEKLSVLEDSGW